MKKFSEWLKKIFTFLFKCTFIILERKDANGYKTHVMNLWNPLAYVALLIVAIIAGVWDGFLSFYIMIKHTIRDSL